MNYAIITTQNNVCSAHDLCKSGRDHSIEYKMIIFTLFIHAMILNDNFYQFSIFFLIAFKNSENLNDKLTDLFSTSYPF